MAQAAQQMNIADTPYRMEKELRVLVFELVRAASTWSIDAFLYKLDAVRYRWRVCRYGNDGWACVCLRVCVRACVLCIFSLSLSLSLSLFACICVCSCVCMCVCVCVCVCRGTALHSGNNQSSVRSVVFVTNRKISGS